jgi:hypothetical protein
VTLSPAAIPAIVDKRGTDSSRAMVLPAASRKADVRFVHPIGGLGVLWQASQLNGRRSPMRARSLTGVVLVLAATAACTPSQRRAGEHEPSGSPGPRVTAVLSTTQPPPAAAPSARPPGGGRASAIRRIDWRNATVTRLPFCGGPDGVVSFRDGSNGDDIPCRMLPDGARPAYGEFLVEEPANAPAREDALVLVELGNRGAARQQALVPIQLGSDGRTLEAWPIIKGDAPSPTGDMVIPFLAYRIEGQTVVTTVKRLDGRTEIRRYRQAGAYGPWERF